MGAIRSYLTGKLLRLKVSSRWDAASRDDERFRRRRYTSYEAYLEHQRAKLARIDLSAYDREYRRVLAARLGDLEGVRRGASVLCLAARLGTEVKAFIDVGCFAVGIDLNPGTVNAYVLHGDFHHLQFADGSADVVFTNSLDHCYDVQRVLGEVRRVLVPGGTFIVEAVRGADEGVAPMFYESFSWATIGDLVACIEAAGFTCRTRRSFDAPWGGEQLCFKTLPA